MQQHISEGTQVPRQAIAYFAEVSDWHIGSYDLEYGNIFVFLSCCCNIKVWSQPLGGKPKQAKASRGRPLEYWKLNCDRQQGQLVVARVWRWWWCPLVTATSKARKGQQQQLRSAEPASWCKLILLPPHHHRTAISTFAGKKTFAFIVALLRWSFCVTNSPGYLSFCIIFSFPADEGCVSNLSGWCLHSALPPSSCTQKWVDKRTRAF